MIFRSGEWWNAIWGRNDDLLRTMEAYVTRGWSPWKLIQHTLSGGMYYDH